MAKARMLSQEAAEDSKLGRCSLEAAFTYLLTIPFLDRDGLCSGKPSWIAGRALQERPELHTQVGSFIQEWITQGLITRYEGSDGPVLFFHGFRKHNAHMAYEKETRSKFPPPPGFYRNEHGLIPNDPEVAGRLCDTLDSRSSYHKALTEATQRDLHKKVATRSELGRDQVATNRTEVEVETEVETEVEVETNNNSALKALALAEAEKAVVVVGASTLIHSFDDNQTMALLSWLWLYNGWYQEDLSYRDIFRRAYEKDPFAGMKQPAAVMVKNAKAGSPAPLQADDRAEMMKALRGLQEATP